MLAPSTLKVFEENICSGTLGQTPTFLISLWISSVCKNVSFDSRLAEGLIYTLDFKDGEETQKEMKRSGRVQ